MHQAFLKLSIFPFIWLNNHMRSSRNDLSTPMDAYTRSIKNASICVDDFTYIVRGQNLKSCDCCKLYRRWCVVVILQVIQPCDQQSMFSAAAFSFIRLRVVVSCRWPRCMFSDNAGFVAVEIMLSILFA